MQDLAHGDRVVTNTMGYKGVEWIVISQGPAAKDGVHRYYLRKPGSFTELLFRVDEFDFKCKKIHNVTRPDDAP
jgi:hypothetical protein